MRYELVVSVDYAKGDCANIDEWRPPFGKFYLTEGDEQYDFAYLGERFAEGEHRKWWGSMSEGEWRRYAEDHLAANPDLSDGVPTAGMLTAHGSLPAVAYELHEADPLMIDGSVYVSPQPESEEEARERLAEFAEAMPGIQVRS